MTEPRVLNKHHGAAPPNSVYIGRPSKWGNPFPITAVTTREKAIEKYIEYYRRSGLNAKELKGKNLVCFCAPLACHGDFLLKEANS